MKSAKSMIKKKRKETETSDDSEESSESDSSVDRKSKKRTPINRGSAKIIGKSKPVKKYNDSESESEDQTSESDTSDEPPKRKQNMKRDKFISKTDNTNETEYFDVDCSNYSTPEYYHDYLIEFEKPYKNVTNITIDIDKSRIPIRPHITDDANILVIGYDDTETTISPDNGDYLITDIIDGLNSELESGGIVSKIDSKGRVIIERKSGPFTLDFKGKMFGKLLGFQEDIYENKSKYVSENSNALEQKSIYMFIPNITSEPFCRIDNDGDIKQMFKLKSPIDILESLIINFRNSENSDENDMYEFYGTPHEYTIKLDIKPITNSKSNKSKSSR